MAGAGLDAGDGTGVRGSRVVGVGWVGKGEGGRSDFDWMGAGSSPASSLSSGVDFGLASSGSVNNSGVKTLGNSRGGLVSDSGFGSFALDSCCF